MPWVLVQTKDGNGMIPNERYNWLASSSWEGFLVLHVSCWGSGFQSNQSRVTQHLRVQGLLRDQSRVTQEAMWWHSLVCSLSLLYRFHLYLWWCTYCWMCLLWLFTFIDVDWWFRDDVLLTCGSQLEGISFIDFILWSWYSIYTWFMYDCWLCGVGIGLNVLLFGLSYLLE